MTKRIAVVGGSCVDLFAASSLPLVAHDSNPGTVTFGFGGVGRNIAENLARLGQDVWLVAPFGSDSFSAQMLAFTAASGVHTEYSTAVRDSSAPYYISVNDSDGDLAVAVNDMEICERITPEFLSGKLPLLDSCDAVILDANIPVESVKYLADHCAKPLFADAVSTRKAARLAPALPHLHTIKANRQEAEALLQIEISAEAGSLTEAANRFHTMGVSYVLITLGSEGAFLSDGRRTVHARAFAVRTVNANGCGDAFGAAAFLGILRCEPPEQILETALAAAAITAKSAQAVSPDLNAAAIAQFLNERRSIE